MKSRLILAAIAVALPSPAGAGIVSHWSFDTAPSDATGAHDGTLVGTAAITTGGLGFGGGEALQISAEGDRVDLAAPAGFDFNADFTWHAYIRTTDGSGAIFARNPAGTAWNQGSKALFVRGSNVQWDTGWVGNPNSATAVNDGNWHQVIATYVAATDQLDVFVDPIAGVTTGQFSGLHDVNRFDEHSLVHNGGLADTSFTIGQANFSGGLNNLDTLVGLIDEAAVFDTALSGAELDQLITQGPASFLSPVTTFTGAIDNDIGDASNWDNGLPSNDGSKPGIVPDGFPALFGDPSGKKITFEGASGYDGDGFDNPSVPYDVTFRGTGGSNFSGEGIVVQTGAEFDWNSSGTATTTSIQVAGTFNLSAGSIVSATPPDEEPDIEGGGLLVISGGTIVYDDDLNVIDGSVEQTGGEVTFGFIGLGDNGGDSGRWSLGGGSLQTGNIQFQGAASVIDFPSGSMATLSVLNSNRDVAAMQAFVTGGNITFSGAVSALSNFVVEVVDIGGIDYTQMRLDPSALLNLFNGSISNNINAAANWDVGLPTNDGSRDGIVPAGFVNLTGSPRGKNITFEGDSSYTGANFGGLEANGYHAVFNGTGSSSFTGNGLFLAWDGGVANASTFAWNSTGTADITRFFIGRFGVGHFVQTAGVVNQNNGGDFDFLIGELAGSEGSSYTMSGGTLNAMGEIAVRRGSFDQSGGEVNAKHANGIEWGEGGAPFTWTLSGGTLRTTALNNMAAGDVIDFPDGSTGVLQVLNSALDPTALAALVASGNITKNGATVAADDFNIRVVSVDGVDYTELSATPGTPLHFTEIVVDADTEMITLTWTSRPGASYTLFVTRTLAEIEGDLGDDIESGGETTTFGPFPNPYDLDGQAPYDPLPPEVFFTVMENPPGG